MVRSRLFTRARRVVLQVLRGPERNRKADFAGLNAVVTQADWQRRGFYLLAVLIAFMVMQDAWRIGQTSGELQALWPVFWVDWVSVETAARTIAVAVPLTTLAAVALDRLWWPRVAVFFAFLQYGALANSFGAINHWFHYPLWIAFAMLLWPAGQPPAAGLLGPSRAMRWMLPAFAAQAMIGLFYSLSGLAKIRAGFFPQEISTFHPDALPLLIMGRWQETGESPLLGPFFASNLWIGWPAYLLVIYIELFFLVAVFRPQIHRTFGAIIAAFHFAVYMFMGISFMYQPAVVALLFLWSPFAVATKGSVRRNLAQLPGVDLCVWIARLMRRRRAVAAAT